MRVRLLFSRVKTFYGFFFHFRLQKTPDFCLNFLPHVSNSIAFLQAKFFPLLIAMFFHPCVLLMCMLLLHSPVSSVFAFDLLLYHLFRPSNLSQRTCFGREMFRNIEGVIRGRVMRVVWVGWKGGKQ